jgi:hypothetical protein
MDTMHHTTPATARRLFPLVGTIHEVAYSARPYEEFVALGARNYWDYYFAGRAAPLGQAPAEVASHIAGCPSCQERLLVAGLSRDFQQIRFDFLRRITGKKGNPAAGVAQWIAVQAPAVAEFRAAVGRMQTIMPVAPAMLAQMASQARNLLSR